MSDDGPKSVNNQLADEFPPDECEHKHWFKDNDNWGKGVRVCEDCGSVIYESDVRKGRYIEP